MLVVCWVYGMMLVICWVSGMMLVICWVSGVMLVVLLCGLYTTGSCRAIGPGVYGGVYRGWNVFLYVKGVFVFMLFGTSGVIGRVYTGVCRGCGIFLCTRLSPNGLIAAVWTTVWVYQWMVFGCGFV